MRRPWIGLGGALIAIAASLLGDPAARACSRALAAPAAFPASGTAGVSTMTSIVVLSFSEPFGVQVTVDGQAVAIRGWTALGEGTDQYRRVTKYWRLWNEELQPNATYAVSLPAPEPEIATLTQFTTGGGYDKAAGTAPVVRDVHLWWVRYPVKDISGGSCVFAEYHSFLTVDYEPATIPNTPAGSVVHTFQLAPETGGAGQEFVYTGPTPFAGEAPEGDYPVPLTSWAPELDPSRTYCLAISASGDGDLARPTMASERLCVPVTTLTVASQSGGCNVTSETAGPTTLALVLLAIALRKRKRIC